jgi:hypothetical protein
MLVAVARAAARVSGARAAAPLRAGAPARAAAAAARAVSAAGGAPPPAAAAPPAPRRTMAVGPVGAGVGLQVEAVCGAVDDDL